MNEPILIIDLGSSSCRLSVVDANDRVVNARRLDVGAQRGDGGAGWMQWDGDDLGRIVLGAATELIDSTPVSEIAIATQRTTCLLWEKSTSRVLGPVLGWADGRTLELDRRLLREYPEHRPGYSATKWRWLLDEADPDRTGARAGELRAGTLDSWLMWVLTEGQVHCTDKTNAAHTGLFDLQTQTWDLTRARRVGIPEEVLPPIVEVRGEHGRASALPGAPLVRVIVGDQQASLVGQGCVAAGDASLSLGTVGAVDVIVGDTPPTVTRAAGYGTVAVSARGRAAFAVETSVQAAGSVIEWLLRVGILPRLEDLDTLVDPQSEPSTCVFVSALDGLGAPHWKFDARAGLLGMSSGHGRSEIIRAVLDGIACAFAEVLDLVEHDSGVTISHLSVSGGLAGSSAMMRILAATTGRELVRPRDVESTTRGAIILARGHERNAREHAQDVDVFTSEMARPADRAAWSRAVTQILNERRSRIAAARANDARGDGI